MQLIAKKSDDPFADIETEADALRGFIIVGGLIKGLKQIWNVFFGNPFSGIRHFEPDLVIDSLEAQRDLARVGEFDGIANQIIEHLPKPDWIGSDPVGDCSVQSISETELLLTGSKLKLVYQQPEKRPDLQRVKPDR